MYQIQSFVVDAPDKNFLIQKVILILGVIGVLRKNDLYNMRMDQVQDMNNHIIVEVYESKIKQMKRYPIVYKEGHVYNPVLVIQKYLAFRKLLPTSQFPYLLMQLRNGKVTKQRVGINTVGDACIAVATYLKLDNPRNTRATAWGGVGPLEWRKVESASWT